jgi:hypothetical protein
MGTEWRSTDFTDFTDFRREADAITRGHSERSAGGNVAGGAESKNPVEAPATSLEKFDCCRGKFYFLAADFELQAQTHRADKPWCRRRWQLHGVLRLRAARHVSTGATLRMTRAIALSDFRSVSFCEICGSPRSPLVHGRRGHAGSSAARNDSPSRVKPFRRHHRLRFANAVHQ